MFRTLRSICLAALLALLGACQGGEPPATTAVHKPHLMSGLGRIHHPITTSSPEAQRYFDQGLALAYGFNHDGAIDAFSGLSGTTSTVTSCSMVSSARSASTSGWTRAGVDIAAAALASAADAWRATTFLLLVRTPAEASPGAHSRQASPSVARVQR